MTIPDTWAESAMRVFAEGNGDAPIVCGETAAGGTAVVLKTKEDLALRASLGLDSNSQFLLFDLEGATDPGIYEQIVGRSVSTFLVACPTKGELDRPECSLVAFGPSADIRMTDTRENLNMNVSFVPGTMCDERLWRFVLPVLAPQIQPTFVSLSNITDRESAKHELSRQMLAPSHIVAFSMGGYLALEYVVAHPKQISSLVIIAASAKGLTSQEKQRRQRMLKQLTGRPYAGVSRMQLAQYLNPSSIWNPAVVGTIIDMDQTLGGTVLQAQMKSTMDRPNLVASLDMIDCPVLIIGSDSDSQVQFEDLHEMDSHLRNSELKMLEGTGHMIPLESPDELGNEINSFYRAKGFLP